MSPPLGRTPFRGSPGSLVDRPARKSWAACGATLALPPDSAILGDVTDPQPDPLSDDEFEAALTAAELRDDPSLQGTWGWTPGRIVAALLVLAMVLWWVWAFSPLAPRGHPDELDDPAYSVQAELRCAVALETVEQQVPPAFAATDMADRADQIDASTGIFAAMVADLAAAAPDPATRDGDLVARWIADWEIYLSDRLSYRDDFRAGIDAAFSVSVVRGGQVTDQLDSFANANGMPSCMSPTDV